MEAGIVGLPNVGKSTLFNALTAAGVPDENYPFCTIEPNVGVVAVPDPRLGIIHKFIKTEKVIAASLHLVDIAGLVAGASRGEGLGNQFLSHIRGVDAIVHLVRCFPAADVAHVGGRVDPLRDVDVVDTELMLADLEQVSGALDKARRQAKSSDKEAQRHCMLLARCQARLDDGKPLRGMTLDESQRRLLKELGLLTSKPVLLVANVDERDLLGQGHLVQTLRQRAQKHGGVVVPVCAKLESEIAELDDVDRREMLQSLGLDEAALGTLTRAAYEILGLRTFFTTRSSELRAWPFAMGTSAPRAAGLIHSDMQRGFIRVEVYRVADLEQYRSEKAIREAGKLRVEGRGYSIQDGDVCRFLFRA